MKCGKIALGKNTINIQRDNGYLKFEDEYNSAKSISDFISSNAGYHDLTHNPVGLWQFNNDLLDYSGNDYHLSVWNGSAQYMMLDNGLIGAYFNGSTVFRTTTAVIEQLQITGDITYECIFSCFSLSSLSALFQIGNLGESLPNNILYQLSLDINYIKPQIIWEYGLGTNVTSTLSANIQLYKTYHIAVVRSGTTPNVILNVYLNGIKVQTFTNLTSPEKDSVGNTQRLHVGANFDPSVYFTGFLSSLKIISSALTDAQVMEEYNRTIGKAS